MNAKKLNLIKTLKLISETAVLFLLTSCQGQQSIFNQAGPESVAVIKLWWILFGVSSFVFIIVFLFLIFPFFKTSKNTPKNSDLNSWFYAGIIATIFILIGIVFTTFKFSSNFISFRNEHIDIEIVGKRWWWEVIYYNNRGEVLFKTANEIHIPVGKAVRFRLSTDNVIHSFWIPALGGKADMTPGHINHLWLQSDKVGVFRGQCAEYCGLQHALMAFEVIAEKPKVYKKWLQSQIKKASIPSDLLAQQGMKVFSKASCTDCHTIRGIFENRKASGPDLTHLMSRGWLAAKTIPNDKGHLYGWVADPNGVKPGALMPGVELPSKDYNALMHYLRTLK